MNSPALIRRPPFPRTILVGAMVLVGLSTTACSSRSDEPSDDDSSDRDDTVPRDPVRERTGGDEPPLHEVATGTVTIVGSSASVPVSNRSFSGLRDAGRDGDEFVRCNHYVDGSSEYGPHLEILAGMEGRLYYQLQAQVFRFAEGEKTLITIEPGDTVEDGSKEMILFAALTHETEEDSYRYWFTVDENAFEPYGSACAVTVEGLDEGVARGSIECSSLFAVPASPDAPVTNAPYPTAQVSIQFDCPLVERDPRGAEVDPESESYCEGSPTPCLILSPVECSLAPGCTPTGSCGGVSESCYSQVGPFSCASVRGCSWDDWFEECVGIAKSCYDIEDDFECILQAGCDWREDCEGDATRCGAFASEDTCDAQGCLWSE